MLKKTYQMSFVLCALTGVSQSALAMIESERWFKDTIVAQYSSEKKAWSLMARDNESSKYKAVSGPFVIDEGSTILSLTLGRRTEFIFDDSLSKFFGLEVCVGIECNGEYRVCKYMSDGSYEQDDKLLLLKVKEFCVKNKPVDITHGSYDSSNLLGNEEGFGYRQESDKSPKRFGETSEDVIYNENFSVLKEARMPEDSKKPDSDSNKKGAGLSLKIISGVSLFAVIGLVGAYVWNKKKAGKKTEDSKLAAEFGEQEAGSVVT